jgi:hypothetical protein
MDPQGTQCSGSPHPPRVPQARSPGDWITSANPITATLCRTGSLVLKHILASFLDLAFSKQLSAVRNSDPVPLTAES